MDVHKPPPALEPVAVSPAVTGRAAVVEVEDADAARGQERLLQVERGVGVRGRSAVHEDDVRRRGGLLRGLGVGWVEEGVHVLVGGAADPYRPGDRQVGGVGQGGGGGGEGVVRARRRVHAHDRAGRGGGVRDAGHGGAVGGQVRVPAAVGGLDVGECAGDGVEQAEPQVAAPVQDREAGRR